ncbi:MULTISPECIES: quinol dehydrogenase ferredoxin subunit NapH [unclassified Nitratiruptor]|uniref:quinol dehydrogenase ferredoxin subunit NapH n=1 Tax=unclassified Nitratiruptor TaxID=2624044 RepID=UPI0019158086|nr:MULTISPECIES: quinol dehydrogenase ferredoxin subunit NapH [unclassified Nitratiruptor]BCD61085.1 ferredoxin-type protein NapH [Nitratiruptor sp. YY08-10]BCD65018.1 ferredoxin-type protein NapH [Nitratiruptor sp. YY08-14]
MSKIWNKYRFLILRRFTQIALLVLYIGGNYWGWKILQGNLSSSKLFDTIPLADPYAVLQIFSTGAIVAMDALIGAVIIAVFYALLGGRAFCSYVCPVNMVTDLANYLRRKWNLDKFEKKWWASRNIRYWVMGLSFILSFILGTAVFELVSPISMTHRGIIFGMGFGWAAIVTIFLFDLFILKNGWCGHICPLGGFYSLIGRYNLFRVKHIQPNCTLCMKCKEVCPEKEVLYMIGKKSQMVDMGECTLCGRCVEVCDDDALHFGIRDFVKKGE